jgi:hypothetical protein
LFYSPAVSLRLLKVLSLISTYTGLARKGKRRPLQISSYLVVNPKVLAGHLPKGRDVKFMTARYREMTVSAAF